MIIDSNNVRSTPFRLFEKSLDYRHATSTFKKNVNKNNVLSQGEKIFVIDFGCKFIKINLANQLYPLTIPNVIARKVNDKAHTRKQFLKLKEIDVQNKAFKKGIKLNEKLLLMKHNITEQEFLDHKLETAQYNNQQCNKPSILQGLLDDKINRRHIGSKQFYYGDKALHLEDSNNDYEIYYVLESSEVIKNELNEDTKKDIIDILKHIIKEEFKVNENSFNEYIVGVVIPDSGNTTYMYNLMSVLLLDLGFSGGFVFQKSMSVISAANYSHGCVIDLGSNTTTVSCVEEGWVIPESIVELNYGTDNLNILLQALLNKNEARFKKFDFKNNLHDYYALDQLRHTEFCVLENHNNEPSVSLKLNEFYHTSVNEKTLKYTFKTYEEPFYLSLFYFNYRLISAFKSTEEKKDLNNTPGQTLPNTKKENKFNKTALDIAIMNSIIPLINQHSMNRFFDNIILVGGGSKILGIESYLTKRIKELARERLNIEVFPNINISARDIDHCIIAWKGTCVLAKLDIVKELIITQSELEIYRESAFAHKILFFPENNSNLK